VAFAAPLVFAGFTWQLGFLLGAVVSPTDSIAATSIARTQALPQRISLFGNQMSSTRRKISSFGQQN
jgi:NhaP-type Na+/H+ or K+/H+ antiporter